MQWTFADPKMKTSFDLSIAKNIVFFLMLCGLYAAFPTNVHFSYGQDAMEYSYWVENGIITKLNRHFLYSLTFFNFYKLWNVLGLRGGALNAGQFLSALFGAGAVMLFYSILKEFFIRKKDYILGLIFTSFYAFSFAQWHFSAEPNPQAFSNFLRLLLVLLIIKKAQKISVNYALGCGLVFSLVLLSEMMGLLLFPAYMVLMYFSTKIQRKLKVVVFGFTAALSFLVFYGAFAVHLLSIRIQDVLPSIFSRAPNTTDFFRAVPSGIMNLFLTMIFMSGSRAPAGPNPELIDLRNILTPASVIFFLFFLTSLVVGFKFFKKTEKKEKGLIYGCLLWFVLLFAVQIVREPSALDNLSYLLPPLWILMFFIWLKFFSQTTFRKPIVVKSLLVVVLIVYILNNFFIGIFPNSKESNWEMFDYYRYIKKEISSDDNVVLVSDLGNYALYELDYLLRYKSDLDKAPILLDAFPYRADADNDAHRYNDYRATIRTQANGYLYIFIVPHREFPDLQKKGDVERISQFIKGIFSDKNSQPDKNAAKHAMRIIEDILVKYDRYVVLEDTGLDCTFIKLER